MEEYILHEFIKVKEINNLEASYSQMEEFTLKENFQNECEYLKKKKYVFDEEKMENNIIKLDTLINLLKENNFINPYEVINEIIIPNFLKNSDKVNFDNKLFKVYFSILNEVF